MLERLDTQLKLACSSRLVVEHPKCAQICSDINALRVQDEGTQAKTSSAWAAVDLLESGMQKTNGIYLRAQHILDLYHISRGTPAILVPSEVARTRHKPPLQKAASLDRVSLGPGLITPKPSLPKDTGSTKSETASVQSLATTASSGSTRAIHPTATPMQTEQGVALDVSFASTVDNPFHDELQRGEPLPLTQSMADMAKRLFPQLHEDPPEPTTQATQTQQAPAQQRDNAARKTSLERPTAAAKSTEDDDDHDHDEPIRIAAKKRNSGISLVPHYDWPKASSPSDGEVGRIEGVAITDIEQSGSGFSAFTVYRCVIRRHYMPPVETLKRYRDFEALRQAILTLRKSLDDGTPVPPLPSKRIIGRFAAEFLKTRRQGLEHFLQLLVRQDPSNANLRAFLNIT